MKVKIWIFILYSVTYVKVSEAQSHRGGYIPPMPTPPPPPLPQRPRPISSTPTAPGSRPNLSPSAVPPPQSVTPPPPPNYFETVTPKCYPETAKAYFLPAPPSQAKVTILDPKTIKLNLKEPPKSLKEQTMKLNEQQLNLQQTLKEQPMIYKEQSVYFDKPASNFKQAPSKFQMASNIISNHASIAPPPAYVPVMPDLIDEVPTLIQKRFSKLTESDAKVCNTYASLIEKLPIFKFDQELLEGFLAGLGL